MKILIVDSSKAMRVIVIRTMRQAGFGDHSMDEAACGGEALKKIEQCGYDLILSDFNLPDISGIELLEILLKRRNRAKFGFVSSNETFDMRRRAMEAGAQFFIVKPFTAETFQQVLGKFLDQPSSGVSIGDPNAAWAPTTINPPRSTWDEYFMNIARVAASRSTCDRKQVGAVIVRDKTILSTGYNGSLRGLPHCDEAGHMLENDHCVATVHAEQNAIVHAARNGAGIDGGTIYVTASPCWSCFKSIANAGLRRIVCGEFYRDTRTFSVAAQIGIEVANLTVVQR